MARKTNDGDGDGGLRVVVGREGPADPDSPVSRSAPPASIAFIGSEWIESEALKGLADELIGGWQELQFLADYEIRVLWKEKGARRKAGPYWGSATSRAGTRATSCCTTG